MSANHVERGTTGLGISQQVDGAPTIHSKSKDFPSAEITYSAPKSVANTSSPTSSSTSTPQSAPTRQPAPTRPTVPAREPLARARVDRSRTNTNVLSLTDRTDRVGKKPQQAKREKDRVKDRRISGIERLFNGTDWWAPATAASPTPAALDDPSDSSTSLSTPGGSTENDISPPSNASTVASSISPCPLERLGRMERSLTADTSFPQPTLSSTTTTKTSKRQQQHERSTALNGGPSTGAGVKKKKQTGNTHDHHSMPALVQRPKKAALERLIRASVSPRIGTLPSSSASDSPRKLGVDELDQRYSSPPPSWRTFKLPFRTRQNDVSGKPKAVGSGMSRNSIGSMSRTARDRADLVHASSLASRRSRNGTAGLSRELLWLEQQQQRRHSIGEGVKRKSEEDPGRDSLTRLPSHSMGAIPSRHTRKQ